MGFYAWATKGNIDLWVLIHELKEPWNFVSRILQIIVHCEHELAFGLGEPSHCRCSLAGIFH